MEAWCAVSDARWGWGPRWRWRGTAGFRIHLEVGLFLCSSSCSLITVYFSFPTLFLRFFFFLMWSIFKVFIEFVANIAYVVYALALLVMRHVRYYFPEQV